MNAPSFHTRHAPGVEAARLLSPVAPQLQPRAYTVEPDTSWLRGYPETVFKLRCYGHGTGYVCDGQPCTYSGEGAEDFADERGRIWVKTGITPAFQSAAI